MEINIKLNKKANDAFNELDAETFEKYIKGMKPEYNNLERSKLLVDLFKLAFICGYTQKEKENKCQKKTKKQKQNQ